MADESRARSEPSRSEASPLASNEKHARQSKRKFDAEAGGWDVEHVRLFEKAMEQNTPPVCWEDIAGQREIRPLLEEAVVLPMQQMYDPQSRHPKKDVLMVGAPGIGKTLISKAVATSCGTTCLRVSAYTLVFSYRSLGDKIVRLMFEMARFYAPTLIFIDDLELLSHHTHGHEASRRVKTELLVRMDGVGGACGDEGNDVMVLAATNAPWQVDEALLRRLKKRLYVPLLSEEGRRQLLDINLKQVPLDDGVDLDDIAEKTEGYTGADMSTLCRDAAMMSIRRAIADKSAAEVQAMQESDINVLTTHDDMMTSLARSKPSIHKEEIEKYKAWMRDDLGGSA